MVLKIYYIYIYYEFTIYSALVTETYIVLKFYVSQRKILFIDIND